MTLSIISPLQSIQTDDHKVNESLDELFYIGSTHMYPYFDSTRIQIFEDTLKGKGYEPSFYEVPSQYISGNFRVYSIKNLRPTSEENESVEWYVRELTVEQKPVTIYIKKEDRAKNSKPWSFAVESAIKERLHEQEYILIKLTNHDKEPVEGKNYPGTQTFKCNNWTITAQKMNESELKHHKLFCGIKR